MQFLPVPNIAGLLPEKAQTPTKRMKYVVSIGGGLSSTFKLVKAAIERYGKENCIFVYCYLPNEHPDMLDLIFEVMRHFNIDVKFIGLGFTPMEIFYMVRFLGNSKTDPCSAILKREAVLKWVTKHCDPEWTALLVGVTYHEIERMIKIQHHWNSSGWKVEAPLADDPSITRQSLMEEVEAVFGWVPEMYRHGFEHHNCHGACVKAGHYQWAMLLWYYPGIYAMWEAGEKLFQELVGPFTILTRGRGSKKRNLSLEQFRLELLADWAKRLPGFSKPTGKKKRKKKAKKVITIVPKLEEIKTQAAMIPGFDAFEGLEENPACFYCAAV